MCLHPAPHSGAYFNQFLPLLNSPAIAPDYPGYGDAPPPPEMPDIATYAEAMLEIVANDCAETVALLGFHTGCLVAIEMAQQRPEAVSQVILIDIPYFNDAERAAKYAEAAQPSGEPGDISHWAFHAAFTYDATDAFHRTSVPGAIIATESSLLEPTRQAALLLSGLEFSERRDITRRVFGESAQLTAAAVNQLLTAFAGD
jgi:pimeloyl-ACP methyl ester carboxylesterase